MENERFINSSVPVREFLIFFSIQIFSNISFWGDNAKKGGRMKNRVALSSSPPTASTTARLCRLPFFQRQMRLIFNFHSFARRHMKIQNQIPISPFYYYHIFFLWHKCSCFRLRNSPAVNLFILCVHSTHVYYYLCSILHSL